MLRIKGHAVAMQTPVSPSFILGVNSLFMSALSPAGITCVRGIGTFKCQNRRLKNFHGKLLAGKEVDLLDSGKRMGEDRVG